MAIQQQLQIKPLLASVKQTQFMLNKGKNQVWALIKSGEVESFGDRRKRWITTESIEAYVKRELERAAPRKRATAPVGEVVR